MKKKLQIYLAFLVAAWYHKGQVRKWTKEPYITHPLVVYRILRRAGVTGQETLVAAILRDTIEDTSISEGLIVRLFGSGVLKIVKEVSAPIDNKNDGRTIHERRLSAVKYFCLGSIESKKLKLADRCHNLPSVIIHNPRRAKTYVVESEYLLRCCDGVCRNLEIELSDIIYEYYSSLKVSKPNEKDYIDK